jgi:hypothetical protein
MNPIEAKKLLNDYLIYSHKHEAAQVLDPGGL